MLPPGLSRIPQEFVAKEPSTVPGTKFGLNKWCLLCAQGTVVLDEVLAAFIPGGQDCAYNGHPLLL